MASIDRSEFELAFWRLVLSKLAAASSGALAESQEVLLRKTFFRLAIELGDGGKDGVARFPVPDARGSLAEILGELNDLAAMELDEGDLQEAIEALSERYADELAPHILGPILEPGGAADLEAYVVDVEDEDASMMVQGEPDEGEVRSAAKMTIDANFNPDNAGMDAMSALNSAFPELSSAEMPAPEMGDSDMFAELDQANGAELPDEVLASDIHPEEPAGFDSEDDEDDVSLFDSDPDNGAEPGPEPQLEIEGDLSEQDEETLPHGQPGGAMEEALAGGPGGLPEGDLTDTAREMAALSPDDPEFAAMFGGASPSEGGDEPSPDGMPDLMGGDMPDGMPDLMGGAGGDMPDLMGGGDEMPDLMGGDMPDGMPDLMGGAGGDMPDLMGGGDGMPDLMGGGDGMPDLMGGGMPDLMGGDMPDLMGGDMPDGMPDLMGGGDGMPDLLEGGMPADDEMPADLAGMDLSQIDAMDPSALQEMLGGSMDSGDSFDMSSLESAMREAEAAAGGDDLLDDEGSGGFDAFLPEADESEILSAEDKEGKTKKRSRSLPEGLEKLPFEEQIRARMLMISEVVEELAEGSTKQGVDELIEHFRAISRPITRSGYRTFASLADVLIQTLEFLRAHPVNIPMSLVNNLRELVLTLNEIVDGRWSKYRTFYWLINKLNTTQREMEEEAEDVERDRFNTLDVSFNPSDDSGDMGEEPDQRNLPDDTITRNRVELSELQEIFVEEAKEHLDLLSQNLLLAEKQPNDQEVIYSLMRSAHSIKGSANISKFPHIGALAHVMEDVMVAIRDNGLTMTPSIIDLLLSSVDQLSSMLAGVEYEQEYDEKAVERLKGQLKTLGEELQTHPERYKTSAEAIDKHLKTLGIQAEQKKPEDDKDKAKSEAQREASTVRVDIEDLNLLRNLAAELVINRTRLSGQLEQLRNLLEGYERERKQIVNIQHRLDDAIETLSEKLGELFESQSNISLQVDSSGAALGVGGRIAALEHSIRGLMRVRESAFLEAEGFAPTEFDRFSEFDVIWRDLREATTHLNDLGDDFDGISNDLDQNISRISNIANDLHEQIMRVRMIPISVVFNRFPRMVRDVARRLGKKIDLELRGEDTPLDKMIIEEIADPMMHLVRNGIDHGIEMPEEREDMEKPETGTVWLEARQEGNQVIIAIRDDGKGIDVEAVKRKAVERGIMTELQAERATESELQNLIFAPGFSTAAKTTDLSGRGVGMDVVKTSIARLKGTVTVQSELGAGTSFIIRLPVTLAISQALLFTASTSRFAIPLSAVDETYMIREDQLMRTMGQEVIKLRNDILPAVRLSQILSLGPPEGEADERPMIVVNTGDRRVGVIVDKLLGREEIVVKNVGSHLKKLRHVSGGTILGDGEVTLILDIFSIVERAKPVRQADTLMAMSETQARPSFDASSYKKVIDETRKKVDDTGKTYGEMPALGPDGEPVSEEPASEPAYAMDHGGGQHGGGHGGPQNILVVDDSISIRRFVSSILENAGYNTTLANDGVDALEKLKAGRFDMILTDLEMPRMHGYELIAEVKQNIAFRSIPIIILTGRAGEKHSRKGMELGASAFLVKPFNEQELLEEINKAISGGVDA